MSPNQVRQEASRLFRDGKSHKEIADHLAAAGHLSLRGKPLSASGVGAMLVRAGKRRRAVRQERTAAPPHRRPSAKGGDRLHAVRSILGIGGMDSDEKLAMIALLLGD